MAKNNNYITLDYFRELRQRAYEKQESFDDFVERIAEKYFPGRGEEWRRRYAFSLHFYGLCVAACQNCQGSCPHHGHRYSLRIKAGSAVPIPYASLELCPRFKSGVERQGKVNKRQEAVATPEADDFDFPAIDFDQGSLSPWPTYPWDSFSQGGESKQTKQQDLFELEAENERSN